MKKIRNLDIDDLMILLGAAGVIGGIWLIYHPAAYIIAGAGLMYLGLTKRSNTKSGG